MVTTTRPGRRANGDGLIRQRSDGRWEARVTLPAGKSKSVYGKTQKEIQTKLQGLRQQVKEGHAVGTERQTVAQFLQQWLVDVVRSRNAPKTYRDYESIVRVHITPALGRHQLTRLTAQQVQAWLNESAKTHSPRSVQYHRAVLRKALNQALKWRLIPYNPAAMTDPPRKVRKRVRPLELEDAKALLSAFTGHPLGGLVTVMLSTGLRPGEALGLTWDAVDLQRGTLTVRQQAHGADLKTEHSHRVLVLPEIASTTLAALPRTSEYVFPSERGTAMDGTNVLHRFQARLAEMGLPRMTLHQLRHGAATLLLTQGASLAEIRDVLGHSSISVTSDFYAHVAPELQRRTAQRLDVLSG